MAASASVKSVPCLKKSMMLGHVLRLSAVGVQKRAVAKVL